MNEIVPLLSVMVMGRKQPFPFLKNQVFQSKAPLDLSFLYQVGDLLRADTSLVYEKRIPQPSALVDAYQPIIPQVLDHDVLLSYPYESIRPFLHMLQEAARDPKVISIRMTLYRLAKNCKVVEESEHLLVAPIYDEKLKCRLREMFITMLSDNVKGRVQQ